METLREVIKQRDNLTDDEFDELLESAKEDFDLGDDPEDILYNHFGIEPDFVFDLLDEFQKL